MRKQIMDAIDDLPEGNVIKLKGRKGFRLTMVGFRVLFEFVDDSTIDVVTIAPRGDVYKK
jgi:mRNA-degrading endonuclease RelE of RelBE toxin-antitoxin system